LATTRAYVTLLEKNGRDDIRTIYTDSIIPNQENNLENWLIRLEITNTGVSGVNTAELVLRIDERGTFVRRDPILIDEDTKNNFLIEVQLKQDLDGDDDFSDPNEQGIIVRGFLGTPTIIQNSSYGEILRVSITGIQYHLKEQLTSSWHLFKSPKQSFEDRLGEISLSGGHLRTNVNTINLPESPLISYRPRGPTTIHDSMGEIIDALSNPQIDGGAFDDYYFEINPDTNYTNWININAEKFGSTDSQVVIDPLSFDIEHTDTENTTVTNNIEYKNHVIMIGDPRSGSLPTSRARFGSKHNHARIRDVWNPNGVSYIEGDLIQYLVPTSNNPYLTLYLRCTQNHTSTAIPDPVTGCLTTYGYWEVDFSETPPFSTNSSAYYKVGETITNLRSNGFVDFYQCSSSNTYPTNTFTSSTSPLSVPSGWVHVCSIPSTAYTEFETYTPYTADVDIWKQTLCGTEPLSHSPYNGTSVAEYVSSFRGVDYAGYAFDWNITKANYNRKNMTNHFETVSPKVVTARRNNQITNQSSERFDGQRFLLDPSLGTIQGSEWSGHDNQIAEWDRATGSWQFSDDPVSSDTVLVLSEAKIYRFNGTNWITKWNPIDSVSTDKPTPFHLCKNVGLVSGATGIPSQAVELTYDWYVDPLNPTSSPYTHHNRTSRGVWISQSTLLPRINTNQYDIGELYGGAGKEGTLDTNNYTYDSQGNMGWNKGILDEDYGRISAISFKIRVSFFQNSAGTELVEGIPEIPLTFWAIDKFDRVWFYKFKVRRNGQWDDATIPFGENSPTNNMYYARWDELATLIDGVPLTQLDFTIKEREFSGVRLDWKYVKYWGIQLDESYENVGLYKNGEQRAYSFGNDTLSQLSNNWYWILLGPLASSARSLLPKHTPVTQNYIRLVAKIAIDDLHFEKELVATSDDTVVTNPRTHIEYVGSESDYLNLKTRAKARQARMRFFPQTAHIVSAGDVRLKFGQSFKVKGSRVVENPSNTTKFPLWTAQAYNQGDTVSYDGYSYQAITNTLASDQPDTSPTKWENLNKYVVSTVTHIFDHDGYRTDIAGFRKFVVSG